MALVGDFVLLEQVAEAAGAVNLNAVLLEALDGRGELQGLQDLEGVGELELVRERLEEAFNRFLAENAAASHPLIGGLETLVHFGVNLRRIREHAVNSRPIGLLLPGRAQSGQVQLYGEFPVECEFDEIWEITQ